MNGRLSKEARALDSTRWDPCQYLTAAQERRLAARFRLHVMNLPPGSLIDWHYMDARAKTLHPLPRRPVPKDQDYWEDLCVMFMVLSEQLEVEGWLAYQVGCSRDNGDDYFRTEKTEAQPWD